MISSQSVARALESADTETVKASLAASFDRAARSETPYRHWTLSDIFGAEVTAALSALDFPTQDVGGVSGARELHNDTRQYFDKTNIARHPVCRALAEAFQDQDTVDLIGKATGAQLDGCFLRIEYAQDTDGFWLKPHTDLGVKKFTLLYYLGPEGHPELGTDVYANADTWSHRAPFEVGGALAFVPSDSTWHGFEPREIPVVRKSLILNYVTEDWRAREQLAYPDTPVSGRA